MNSGRPPKTRFARFKDYFKATKLTKGPSKFKKTILTPVSEEFEEFCNTTSLHGLRHVANTRVHNFERIFWLAMVISLSYFAVSLCVSQFNRFITNPTVVSIRRDYRTWITKFPAITVCLSDKLDEGLAKEFIEKKWGLNESEEKFMYYQDFLRLVVSVSFRTNLRQFWRFDNDVSLQNLDLMYIVSKVARPMTVNSIIHNVKKQVIWEPIITEMGMCYTFNSIFSRYQSVLSWVNQRKDKRNFSSLIDEDQLLTCDYMNKQCHVKFNILNTTGKYFIHSPYEVVEITSNPTEVVQSGEEFEIEFRAASITAEHSLRSLNIRQRRCKYPDEHVSKNIPAYSNALCQIECRSRMAVVFCGCRPYFFIVGEGKECNLEGMCCIARNMEVLINLPTNLAKCSCVPQCTEINYMPYTKRLLRWKAGNDSLNYKKSTAKIILQVPKVIMHKSIVFTFADLVASFGGTGALFLGLSFLSLVEVFLCIFKMSRKIGKNLICCRNRIKASSP